MHNELILHHRPHRRVDLSTKEPFRRWQTCMRQILFMGPHEPIAHWQPGDEIYRDADAYRFLLEVITGLKSSLIGETEIFGQFKIFIEQWESESSTSSLLNKELIGQLLLDAKKVRTEALTSLGSQSYGSIARKWLDPREDIHLVGYGQLAQEILPWVVKSQSNPIRVYSRRPQRAAQSLKLWKDRLEFHRFPDQSPQGGGLILCAPVSAQEIQQWASGGLTRILDLRGEAERDPLQISEMSVLDLKEAIAQMESNKQRIQQKVRQAQQLIDQSVRAWHQSQKVRPFGWDDLCA